MAATKPTNPNPDALEAIARVHLGVETLEERRMDSLDFHNVAVWQIAAALEAAYKAGAAAAGGAR